MLFYLLPCSNDWWYVCVLYQSLESEECSILLGIAFRLALRAVNHQPIGQLHLTHY